MPVTVYSQSETDSLVSNTAQGITTRIDGIETRLKKLEDAAVPSPTPTPTGSGFYWPAYTYPTSTTWSQFAAKAKANPTKKFLAAINPSSGVGSGKDNNYVTGIASLKANANTMVIGYVYTSYGARSDAAVKNEIDLYKSWYNVDGIFFDEMANTAGSESKYKAWTTYIKSIGMKFVMGNPGTSTITSYFPTVDCILIYETGGLPSISTIQSRMQGQPKEKGGIIPYGVSTLDQQYVKDASKYVGWIYITNDGLPNPWDSLSAHSDTIIAAL